MEYSHAIDALNTSQQGSGKAIANNTGLVAAHAKTVTEGGKSVADYTQKTLTTAQTLLPFSKSVGEAASQFKAFKE